MEPLAGELLPKPVRRMRLGYVQLIVEVVTVALAGESGRKIAAKNCR